MMPVAALRFAVGVASLILAGCLSQQGPAAAPATEVDSGLDGWVFAPPRLIAPKCLGSSSGTCFEPSTAAGSDGKVYVTTYYGQQIFVADSPFGEFVAQPAPPMPAGAPPSLVRGDTTLFVDAKNRLYFLAILYRSDLPYAGAATSSLQVARSDDGGLFWVTNRFVSFLAGNVPVVATDRPWLAFGPQDTVYLSYWNWAPATGVWVSRSTDAGRTFGAFVRAVPQEQRRYTTPAGPPVVDGKGRVLLPYSAELSPTPFEATAVRLASSTDGGQTFTQITAANPGDSERMASFWPVVTVDAYGGWHVFWIGGRGGLYWVVSSDEGKTWSKPGRLNAENDSAWLAPWAVSSGGSVLVMWYSSYKTNNGTAQRLTLATIAVGSGAENGVRLVRVAEGIAPKATSGGLADRTTDFAQFGLPGGINPTVAWSDPGLGLMLTHDRMGSWRV